MVKTAIKSPLPKEVETADAMIAPKKDDQNPQPDYWPSIASKDDIPGWLRDNDFIVHGHPMPTYSYRRSFRLWRCLHMESVNIWTHLVGSLTFFALSVSLYQNSSTSRSLHPGTRDIFAFGVSFLAAIICFGLSTTFHTLRSHSYNVHHFWGKMDILGICVLALGGGMSMTYYAFYCNPTIQWIYWILNITSAGAAAVTLFDTGGGGNKMRTIRGGVFSALALSAMLPAFHSVALTGWDQASDEIGLHWYLAEALTLLLGVGLFVGRLPERLSPGSFDIWGHSHQLFHTCAVVGTGFHVLGLKKAFEYRQDNMSC